ncbi:MAG: ribbon-helix-helix protein, CopG family [Clostridia bacterium]|nr:ribbon-helix-helix protein, CopG family [Clostridia bacterium]
MKGDKIIVKPKRPKGEDGYKTFSVRIKETTVQSLDDIAAKTGRSRNELIGTFLAFAIEHCEITE